MATVEQTMMKVQRILTGPMNLRIQLTGDFIQVTFTGTSTHVNLRVVDWGKNKDGEPRTLVRVSSPVLRGVKPTPALFEHLVREGSKSWFGAYSVGDDEETPGTLFIVVGHSLLGDFLDEEELSATVWNVLGAADEADDVLQQKFGGKRSLDD